MRLFDGDHQTPDNGVFPPEMGCGRPMGHEVLIVHASRRGSAADIAERVGDVFREAGHDVVVWTACEMPSPRNYALVVVGGACMLAA